MVTMSHVRCKVGRIISGSCAFELGYGISEVEVITAFRAGNSLCRASILILKVTEEHHTFSGAVSKILVHLQAVVLRIFLEFGNGTSKLSCIGLVIGRKAWSQAILAVMVSIDGHRLHIAEIITHLACRNGPPESVTCIHIMDVALGRREAEEDFRRVLIIPVKDLIPGGLQRVGSIFAADDFLCHFGAFRVFLCADIDIGIQIQTH